jgi:membrane-bound inhibitor of C-type lysozyme
MTRYANLVVGAAIAAVVACLSPVFAQTTTFRNYHCADGTDFIVGSYPYDSRIYLQIDGGPVTLRRRLAVSGSRYSGSGVTLKISKAGIVTVRRSKRAETACELK